MSVWYEKVCVHVRVVQSGTTHLLYFSVAGRLRDIDGLDVSRLSPSLQRVQLVRRTGCITAQSVTTESSAGQTDWMCHGSVPHCREYSWSDGLDVSRLSPSLQRVQLVRRTGCITAQSVTAESSAGQTDWMYHGSVRHYREYSWSDGLDVSRLSPSLQRVQLVRRTGCITSQSVTAESSARQESTSRRRVSTRHQHARHARRQRNLCTFSAALISPLLCGPSHARPHCALRSVCPFILPSVRLSHTGL